jgi:hypothetical protein
VTRRGSGLVAAIAAGLDVDDDSAGEHRLAVLDLSRGEAPAADDRAGGFELVLLAHPSRGRDARAHSALLARAFSALRAGGRVAVLEALGDETRSGPPVALPFSTHVVRLRAAGFRGVERVDLGGTPPRALLVARREG